MLRELGANEVWPFPFSNYSKNLKFSHINQTIGHIISYILLISCSVMNVGMIIPILVTGKVRVVIDLFSTVICQCNLLT